MLHRFSRSELLLGTENIKKLAQLFSASVELALL